MTAPGTSTPGALRVSLCMATMNRSAVIGETFAGIAAQEDRDGVELVLIDGSGDDSTERVLAGWRDRLPPVRYERTPPRGFDRDYCRAVERSSGDYCWLLSDDDVWRPGALATVRRALSGRPDFVVVNAEVRDAELRATLVTHCLPLASDRTFRAGEDDELAVIALSHLGYIGAVVVRRELWMARPAEPYFGSDFVHVGILMQRPIEQAVVVIAQPQMVLRFGAALWTSRFFGIWMFQWPELVWSFTHLAPETRRKVTLAEPWRRLRQLLLLRAQGHYSRSDYMRWLAGKPMTWWRRVACRVIAAVPVRGAARLAWWYFAARGRASGLLEWELRQNLNLGRKQPVQSGGASS